MRERLLKFNLAVTQLPFFLLKRPLSTISFGLRAPNKNKFLSIKSYLHEILPYSQHYIVTKSVTYHSWPTVRFSLHLYCFVTYTLSLNKYLHYVTAIVGRAWFGVIFKRIQKTMYEYCMHVCACVFVEMYLCHFACQILFLYQTPEKMRQQHLFSCSICDCVLVLVFIYVFWFLNTILGALAGYARRQRERERERARVKQQSKATNTSMLTHTRHKQWQQI